MAGGCTGPRERGWKGKRAAVTTSISPVDAAALSTFDIVHVLDPMELETHLKFVETQSTFDYFQATREYLDGRAHAHSTPVTLRRSRPKTGCGFMP
jgi:hypothetical protein